MTSTHPPSAELDRPIIVVSSDSFATCPECGRRLEVDTDEVVGEDEDGPIYVGTCPTHGAYRFQAVEDDEPFDDE